MRQSMLTKTKMNRIIDRSLFTLVFSIFIVSCKIVNTKNNHSPENKDKYNIVKCVSVDTLSDVIAKKIMSDLKSYESCDYNIIICTYGMESEIEHYMLYDSILNYRKYAVKNDSLIILSNETKQIIGAENYMKNVQGCFQISSNRHNSHSYFKKIYFLKKDILVSEIFAYEVLKSTFEIPFFNDIKDHIFLFKYLQL